MGSPSSRGTLPTPFVAGGVAQQLGAERITGVDTIRLTVMAAVMLSMFAHGISAGPGIGLYDRRLLRLGAGAPELEPPVSGPAGGG